jgi:hypothetical protein
LANSLSKEETRTNLNLNLSFFHTQSQPQSLFLKIGDAHEKLLERGDVPLLNNYPMELGSEEKWLNRNITQINFFILS